VWQAAKPFGPVFRHWLLLASGRPIVNTLAAGRDPWRESFRHTIYFFAEGK
jgi:hypothetical protein